jgi:hypothetical protein
VLVGEGVDVSATVAVGEPGTKIVLPGSITVSSPIQFTICKSAMLTVNTRLSRNSESVGFTV